MAGVHDRYEGRADVRECAGGRTVESTLPDDQCKLIVLKSGWTVDRKRFYTAECVKRAAADNVFANRKMFCDHSGPMDNARGTRSTADWWATTGDETWYDEATESVQAIAHAHHDQAKAILRNEVARAACEFSHDSYVEYHRDEIEETKCMAVDRIVQCNSVDFVPWGNAGGQVTEAVDEEEVNMTPDEIREAVAAGVREGLGEDMLNKLDGMVMGISALRDVISGWTLTVAPEYRDESATESAETDAPADAEPVTESDEKPDAEPATEAAPEAEAQEVVTESTPAPAPVDIAVAIAQALDAAGSLSATERKRAIERLVLIDSAELTSDIAKHVGEAVEAVREETRAILREHGVATRVSGGGPSAPVTESGDSNPKANADRMLAKRGASDRLISAAD